jgi:hypothetical protein
MVLARLDLPPCPVYLAKVLSVDEFREHAEVQLWGTQGGWRSAFAPEFNDPKDNKTVYTARPLARYVESTATLYAEHILSVGVGMLRSSKVPSAVAKAAADWEVAAGYVRKDHRKRKR